MIRLHFILHSIIDYPGQSLARQSWKMNYELTKAYKDNRKETEKQIIYTFNTSFLICREFFGNITPVKHKRLKQIT